MIKEITVIDKLSGRRYKQYFLKENKDVEEAAKKLNITTETVQIVYPSIKLYGTDDDYYIPETTMTEILDFKDQYKVTKEGNITIIE